jgi:hypothetical protein
MASVVAAAVVAAAITVAAVAPVIAATLSVPFAGTVAVAIAVLGAVGRTLGPRRFSGVQGGNRYRRAAGGRGEMCGAENPAGQHQKCENDTRHASV